jgi:hypothetical protein
LNIEEWAAASKDERRQWIRERAADGESSARIAAQVGVTRNVIIGHAHRARPRIALGVGYHYSAPARRPGRLPVAATQHMTKPTRERVMVRRPDPPPKPFRDRPALDAPKPAGTILDLSDSVCRFPMFSSEELVATTRPSELAFCCAPIERKTTYCEFHQRLVTQAVPA